MLGTCLDQHRAVKLVAGHPLACLEQHRVLERNRISVAERELRAESRVDVDHARHGVTVQATGQVQQPGTFGMNRNLAARERPHVL